MPQVDQMGGGGGGMGNVAPPIPHQTGNNMNINRIPVGQNISLISTNTSILPSNGSNYFLSTILHNLSTDHTTPPLLIPQTSPISEIQSSKNSSSPSSSSSLGLLSSTNPLINSTTNANPIPSPQSTSYHPEIPTELQTSQFGQLISSFFDEGVLLSPEDKQQIIQVYMNRCMTSLLLAIPSESSSL